MSDKDKIRRFGQLDTDQGPVIEIDMFYELGGVNHATGKNRGRGYYLSVAPVTYRKTTKGTSSVEVRKYVPFSGVVYKLQPAKRFSPKVIETLTVDVHVLEMLVKRVLKKNDLTLKDDED